jgi:hypothetical protein
MSMGNGGFARGKLTYLKQANGKAGQTVVKVSGLLLNDSFKQPGTRLILKKVRYVVSGNQTYDHALREWISGKLSFKISYLMEANDKLLGYTEGIILVVLETLPSKR